MLSSRSTGLEPDPAGSGLTIQAANTLCGIFKAIARPKRRSTFVEEPIFELEARAEGSLADEYPNCPAHGLWVAKELEVCLQFGHRRQGEFFADAVPDMLRDSRPEPLSLTFDAVGMAVLLARLLRTVADQKARITGELIIGLRDDLNDELFGNELATGGVSPSETSASSSSWTTDLASGALAVFRASREFSWDSLTSVRSSS